MAETDNVRHHLDAVKRELGWTNDAFIPFCNDENRELLNRMEILTEEKRQKSEHSEKLQERVEWLREHYKSAEIQIEQNQRLICSLRKQRDEENHLEKIVANELTATTKDIRDLERKSDELATQDRLVQGTNSDDFNETKSDLKLFWFWIIFSTDQIETLNRKIDDFSSDMHWMKHALTEWMQAIEDGDKTNALIEKYAKEDEKSVNIE